MVSAGLSPGNMLINKKDMALPCKSLQSKKGDCHLAQQQQNCKSHLGEIRVTGRKLPQRIKKYLLKEVAFT